ncbi:MAG: D-tyrosyl-tRNA(Tyr) deacylase [Bacteroidetes bacterium]|nr:D-tyrosyl-tRNA(Tyr) deacylase [Bacteroidota bacterium]
MRAVIQRVARASVSIEGNICGKIEKGILILLGIEEADESTDIEWLSGKISRLRIFDDESGVMNLSITEACGDIMIVSQFTLHASTKKGNRPSYIKAARPEKAIPLYEMFIRQMHLDTNRQPQTGEFGAMMKVELVNDGPVTIIIDSRNRE